MIIVDTIGKNQILAKDNKGHWYNVNDPSVKVGDVVSSKICTKLKKSLCEFYNAADNLLNSLEKSSTEED